MQQVIETQTGVRCRLLTKTGEPLLWMEVYEGVADRTAFTDLLARRVTECGIEALLAGAPRHIECFQEAPPF